MKRTKGMLWLQAFHSEIHSEEKASSLKTEPVYPYITIVHGIYKEMPLSFLTETTRAPLQPTGHAPLLLPYN
jgi:hypothetical protein